jgi:hypothetical protein
MRVVKPLKMTVADQRILEVLLENGGDLDEALTPVLKRRIEIVVLAAQGWSNKNIASKVGVEPSVVARRRKVFQKRYEIAPFPGSWSRYARVNALRPYFADLPRSGRPKK